MKKITKKQSKEFVEGITKGLLKIGAVIQPEDKRLFPQTLFKLDTIVGLLTITLYHEQDIIFTIFSRFEDVDKAKQKFDCNRFTGKFNFHRSQSELFSMEQMIEFALIQFEATQPKELA